MTRFPPLTTATLLVYVAAFTGIGDIGIAASAAPSGAPTDVPTESFYPSSPSGVPTDAPIDPTQMPTMGPSSSVPSLAPTICTNTKKGRKFKVKGVKQEKRCGWYANKGKCYSKIADKDGGGRVFSACGKSCGQCAPCVNIKKERKFKVKGVKQETYCFWYAKKGKCQSKIAVKDGGGQVFLACAKSCRIC